MKISTKGRYGLRAMVDIATESNDKCITVKSIANRQGISEHYLEQLISQFKKYGLLKSIRGAQGGYVLTAPPSEIKIGEILRAVEGPMLVATCLDETGEVSNCNVNSCKTCVTKSVWEKLQSSIDDVLDSITLEQLVNDYKILIDE